ncbi:MAG: phosphatidylinositol mannoside acyltransferase [Actinobacteria bacterium]|nr:phosphatidylinositol mannoside acyltransferase [Actinomycetota bacterium]
MKERLSALAYFAGWRIVRSLPEKTAYKLFSRISSIMFARGGSSVERLRFNLSRVSPHLKSTELDELVRKSLDSYLRYWCDTFRIQDWSKDRIHKSVSLRNEHLLLDPMKDGRGVVIILPHSGNWDHAGAYFCSLGIQLVTVAERLKPEALFVKFLEYRQSMGFEVLGLDARSFGTLMNRAREKRLIALVADRDLSRSGIDVNFFGFTARMPAGPALLAIRTGIPLVVAHVSYTANGIHIDFNEVDVPSLGDETERIKTIVQRSADLFAQGISEHPEDWHMLQRIWIDGDFKERE